MRGEKVEETGHKRTVLADWPWTHQTREFTIPVPFNKIKKVEIDPSRRMTDLNSKDNVWPVVEDK